MDTQDLERRLEEFRAAHAESVEATEGLATRVGLRERSDDWLRRLPAPVADAVRRAAGDWARRFDDPSVERPTERVVARAEARGRMSPMDFVYRTMGR
ncbi:MAG: hypothetical protein JXB32_17420 [Deltaproteobacteria bacterium]|nr:hypothetical protein [Deltaproteobacteria bacterium]